MSDTKQPRSHGSRYLFLCANTWFHIVIAAIWNSGWLWYCYQTGEWHWFMRSGAVTVVIGAVVTFRNVIRLTTDERTRFRNMNVIEVFSDSEKRDQERDSAAVLIGVWIMVIGTTVAAYGDLLCKLLPTGNAV